MKSSTVLLAALTFANPILGYVIGHGFSPQHSLSNRALPEVRPGEVPRPHPVDTFGPIPEPPKDNNDFTSGQNQANWKAGTVATYQRVNAYITSLKTPKWVTSSISYAQENTPKWVTDAISKAQENTPKWVTDTWAKTKAQAQALWSTISSRLTFLKSAQGNVPESGVIHRPTLLSPIPEEEEEEEEGPVSGGKAGTAPLSPVIEDEAGEELVSQDFPTSLVETDAHGYPLNTQIWDLSDFADDLKKVEHSLYAYEYPRDSNLQVLHGNAMVAQEWVREYYAPRDAVAHFFTNGELLPRVPATEIGVAMRSVSLSDLSRASSTSSTEDPTPAALFAQYLSLYYAIQTSISTAVRPVLDNLTSHTNNTIIHQMADSVYYDITGSTTALIGPFNNGMSFVNNKTIPANATDFVKTLESVYARMWMKALTAANSTGMYGQQIYLAGILNANDTSVYPPGWTTVAPHGS